MKFYIRAEFLDTKLFVFILPKASQANTNEKKYIYGNFANFNLCQHFMQKEQYIAK